MAMTEPHSTRADAAQILTSEPPALAEWEAICAASPAATPFHTPHWCRAIAAAYPEQRDATRLFRFTDGTLALFPMHESGPGGRLCRRVSVEPGVYGGPISDRPLAAAHFATLAAHFTERSPGGCAVVGNPFAGGALPVLPGCASVPLQTHLLPLEGGAAGVWRGMTKGHRCNVRQAERLGVRVAVAAGAEAVAAYYAVYQDSIRRWGAQARSCYPESLFHHLLAAGEPFARLWLARAQGEIVSGALVLSWGPVAVYWHGATLERAFALRPSHAVVMAAIEDAIARGCRWFDFNPSGGLEGVIRFKEGFGARPVECATWELPPRPAARFAQRVAGRLAGSVAGRNR
jgi:hypothetical protein